MPIGADGPEPTLLVKASSLQLKYLLVLKSFRLMFLRVDVNWLAYGIEIVDDPTHPALIWSLLEYDDERAALRAVIERPLCVVHLFNEILLNVAWTEVEVDLRQAGLSDVILA